MDDTSVLEGVMAGINALHPDHISKAAYAYNRLHGKTLWDAWLVLQKLSDIHFEGAEPVFESLRQLVGGEGGVTVLAGYSRKVEREDFDIAAARDNLAQGKAILEAVAGFLVDEDVAILLRQHVHRLGLAIFDTAENTPPGRVANGLKKLVTQVVEAAKDYEAFGLHTLEAPAEEHVHKVEEAYAAIPRRALALAAGVSLAPFPLQGEEAKSGRNR